MTTYTRTRRAAVALLVGLIGIDTAQAARDTDVAAFLHGEVGFGLQGSAVRGDLMEGGDRVGRFREGESGILVNARFGVLPGLELFGELPYVSNGYRNFTDVAAMQACNDGTATLDGATWISGPDCYTGSAVHLETNTNSRDVNTYVPNAAAESVPSYSFNGMDNVAVGLRWAPFHEAELGGFGIGRRPGKRLFPPLATWRLELAILVNAGGSIYTNEAGEGSTGLRLGTSFSKRIGVSDPYLSISHSRYSDFQVAVTDAEGASSTLTLSPASETDFWFGIELIPYEDARTGAKFSVDFAGGGNIRWENTLPSGYLVPGLAETTTLTNADDSTTTYESTTGQLVTEETRVAFQGRLRLHYQIFRYLRLQAGGSLGYAMPHRLETPYNISLGRTILTRFGAELSATF